MKDNQETANEKYLEQLFVQMRRVDAKQTPDFPDKVTLAKRDPAPVAHSAYRATPKVAAAIAVLAALTLLLSREPPQQDPALLYAEVMNASSVATDSLLSVSPGTLPGMTDLPEVYETGTTLTGEQQRTN